MAKNEKNHTNIHEDQNSFRNIIADSWKSGIRPFCTVSAAFPQWVLRRTESCMKTLFWLQSCLLLGLSAASSNEVSINVNCGGYPRDGDKSTGNSLEPIRLILHRLLKSYQMVSVFTHCYSWTNNEKNHMQTSQWLLYDFAPTAFPHFLFDYHGCFIGRVCSQHSLRTTK